MSASPRLGALALCLSFPLQAGACDSAGKNPRAAGEPAAQNAPARVDTIRDHLTVESYRLLRSSGGETPRSVLLVLRGSDVRSCEDLGRQARELQRWATAREARLVVWVADDSARHVTTFFHRERIRPASVIRSASVPGLRNGAELATPAALWVVPGGAARGTAHPDRVANVRTASFAAELEELLTVAPGTSWQDSF